MTPSDDVIQSRTYRAHCALKALTRMPNSLAIAILVLAGITIVGSVTVILVDVAINLKAFIEHRP